MNKGGYQIINLLNMNFVNTVSMVVDGIYDKIEGSIKPILLSGITIDDVEYHDLFVNPIVIGSSYVISAYGYIIEISDIDVVTVTKVEDTIVINANIEATETYYDIDEDTYNKLTNMSYDSIPNKIDITYTGKRYISTVLSFNGEKVAIVVNNTIVVITCRIYDGKYQIKI